MTLILQNVGKTRWSKFLVFFTHFCSQRGDIKKFSILSLETKSRFSFEAKNIFFFISVELTSDQKSPESDAKEEETIMGALFPSSTRISSTSVRLASPVKEADVSKKRELDNKTMPERKKVKL